MYILVEQQIEARTEARTASALAANSVGVDRATVVAETLRAKLLLLRGRFKIEKWNPSGRLMYVRHKYGVRPAALLNSEKPQESKPKGPISGEKDSRPQQPNSFRAPIRQLGP